MASSGSKAAANSAAPAVNGGRFDFDDGGTYCGGWEDGKAHGHGVCTGPKGQGEYSGSWHYGFEVSGIYTWPSGSTYEGQWQNGKRHGLGVESRGRWLYRGEWTQGFKGRYGVRQSVSSVAKYEGTWANGLQDGYGSETYADSGSYKGQWLRGLRHGYGVRTSAQFGQASVSRSRGGASPPSRGSTTSLRSDGDPLADRDRKVDDGRGGFVLRMRSDEVQRRRNSLVEKSSNIRNVFKMRRQRSTGDIQTNKAAGSIRSTGSSASWMSTGSAQSAYTAGDQPDDGSNASFIIEDEHLEPSVVETYMGEWKNDKRSGFGVSERTDGLKYEGEWFSNRKYGYGVTTFKDGSKEEGKYKNNVLMTSNKKKHVFLIRSAKFRERIESAVAAAQRAAKIAMQKEDIGISSRCMLTCQSLHVNMPVPGADLARTVANAARRQIEALQPSSREILPNDAQPVLYNDSSLDDTAMSSIPISTGPGYTSSGLIDFQPPSDPGGRRQSNLSMEATLHIRSDSLSGMPQERGRNTQRGGQRSRGGVQDSGFTNIPSNIMNDRFDHYNKPSSRATSRDRSIDRFASRGTTPVPTEIVNPRSRAPSAQRHTAPDCTPDSGVFEDDPVGATVISGGSRRPSRPTSMLPGEGVPLTGNGSVGGSFNVPYHIPANQKEAEALLRQRACGQLIPQSAPTPGGPVKRTESLYINPVIRQQQQQQQQPKAATSGTALKRKKSLPDDRTLPATTPIMSREQASVLSSAQRETFRRQYEDAQRYQANPLLYLTSPSVQDWISRQKLVLLILFLNLSLALMFFKLLS
ncbi:junctophilin-1 [Hyalella azteca]|uniref:Junctophilin-1 n=1 Tax=Hyalella azteca TaxID=294128 RepID=A0A979FUB7_HYAAZ|nr:junctophilin-1 [Hyalella azteca]